MSTTPSQEPVIRRIRALCAKADATSFPEEAEAFLAKAQELMTRHSIDDAVVRRSHGRPDEGIVCRAVVVSAPYASARVSLLTAACRPNHCQVVLDRRGGGQQCFVVGHSGDVELALTLYGHLDQQAVRALRSAPADGGRTRAFRHAFLLSYGIRIGQRLCAAADGSRVEEQQRRGPSVALALRDRRDAVDRALEERFPFARPARSTASSRNGLVRGRAAADRATLGRPEVGGRLALPEGSG